MTRVAILVVVSLTAAASLGLVRAAAQGPPVPSRGDTSVAAEQKLIETVCGSCHAKGSSLRTHYTRQAWEEILEWMIDEGAVLTDDEFEQVLRYLSVRYGRVDVNAAPASELRTVLELTDDQVGRITAARTSGRRFRAIEELAAVIDVPPAILEARKARIDFGEGE